MNQKFAMFCGLLLLAGEIFLWSQFTSTAEKSLRVELQNASSDSKFATHAQELQKVPGSQANGASAETVYTADFTFSKPPNYLDSVTILFVTFAGPPVSFRAELDIGSCAASRQQIVVKDNEFRQFNIDRRCVQALNTSAGTFQIRLFKEATANEPKIGLWTRRYEQYQVPGQPHIVMQHVESGPVYLIGHFDQIGSLQPWSKLKRLCWLWSPPLADYWIAVGVLLNVLLGAGLWAVHRLLSRSPLSLGSLRRGVLAFVAVVGVGSVWSVLLPPFQAPDEPDHLLSFLHLVSPGLSEAPVAEFAKRIHFERIKFHPFEQFQTVDMSAPFNVAWGDHVSAPDAPTRSPAGALIWRTFASMAASWIAPAAAWLAEPGLFLLSLRIFSLLIVGVAFAGSVVVMSAGKVWQAPEGQLSQGGWWSHLTWFMTLPNLAFFFVSVNTYTALFAGFAVFAAALCAAEADYAPRTQSRTPAQWFGFIAHFFALLAACFALLLGGQTGAAYYFVWLSLLLIAALRQRTNEGQWVALLFFSVIGPGLFWLTKGVFAGYDLFGRAEVTAFFWIWLFGGIPAGLFALLFFRYLAGKSLSPRLMTTVRLFASIFLFLLLYVSLIFVQDGLHNIEKDPSLPRTLYVWDALKSFFLSAAAGAPDYYTAETFWSAFGWLESMWHPAATKALQIVTLLGLIRMALHWLSRSEALLAMLRLVVFTGLIGALAYGFHSVQVNLHGRYMVGVYLIAFVYSAIGWTHLNHDIAKQVQLKNWDPRYMPIFALTAGLVVQLYAVTFVFTRFF